MSLRDMRVRAKLWIIVGLSLAGLLLAGATSLTNLYGVMYDGQKDKARSVVEAAHTLLRHYADLAEGGAITLEQAQTAAREGIASIRYQGEEYVWINDMDAVIVMHPIKPELAGKDMSGVEDSSGKRFFQAFVDTVRENGSGYVEYQWPKPGSDAPVDKISYVQGFAPWGWVLGSGLYLDDTQARFLADAAVVVAVLLVVTLLAAGISLAVARNIARPLDLLTEHMDALAAGDKEAAVPCADQKDEIGAMARSVKVFQEGLREADRLAESQRRDQEAEAARARRVAELAATFDREATGYLDTVGHSARGMTDIARGLSDSASETSRLSTGVAAAAEQASANVETVAAAAEELSSSIGEITRQVNQSTEVATRAVREVEATDTKIQGLADAAQRIGEVVALITDIAEQTNLLALNATIEAARAGEAGKGFAVVASEVKNLANQTARATDEIATQIGGVQSATQEAVAAVRGIGETITRINEISSAIAAAVEQQGAATGEIARNVEQASSGTRDVSSSIARVSDTASDTGRVSGDVLTSAEGMVTAASDLGNRVKRFLDDVKTA